VHQYYEQELFTPSIKNIRNRLIEIGTSPKDIERWSVFIIKLLENTKNDEKFDWLFKQRDSTQTEAEFIVDARTIAIDRLFIDAGTLWVIDFKTAKPAENEPLNKFIQRQQNQHAKPNFSSFLVFSSSLIINTDQRSISLGDVPISIRRLRIFLKFIKSQYAVPSIAPQFLF
jgi:hypothetical protein